jgi:hypothetical protein
MQSPRCRRPGLSSRLPLWWHTTAGGRAGGATATGENWEASLPQSPPLGRDRRPSRAPLGAPGTQIPGVPGSPRIGANPRQSAVALIARSNKKPCKRSPDVAQPPCIAPRRSGVRVPLAPLERSPCYGGGLVVLGMPLNCPEFRSVSGTSAFIPRYVTGSLAIAGDSGAVRTTPLGTDVHVPPRRSTHRCCGPVLVVGATGTVRVLLSARRGRAGGGLWRA